MSDGFVNNRRVKRRYRGGIQTSLHNCYAKAPQKLRGFFLPIFTINQITSALITPASTPK